MDYFYFIRLSKTLNNYFVSKYKVQKHGLFFSLKIDRTVGYKIYANMCKQGGF